MKLTAGAWVALAFLAASFGSCGLWLRSVYLEEQKEYGSSVEGVAATPDGRLFVLRARGLAEHTLADPDDEKKLFDLERGDELSISGDGKRIAIRRNREIVIWDVPSQRALRRFRLHGTLEDGGVYLDVHGDRAAIASGEHVTLWGLSTGRPLRDLGEFGEGTEIVAFDGRRVVVQSRSAGVCWVDLEAGDARTALGTFDRPVEAAALGPNGSTLCVGDINGVVRIIRLPVDLEKRVLTEHQGERYAVYQITAIAFSAEGRRVASVDSKGGVRVTDVETGDTVLRFDLRVSWLPLKADVAFSADGARVVAGAAAARGVDLQVRDLPPLPPREPALELTPKRPESAADR